jgi:hypothetical protein
MRVRGETPELMAEAPPFPAEGLVTLANWQEPPLQPMGVPAYSRPDPDGPSVG